MSHNQRLGARSLVETCQRKGARFWKDLESIGDIPYAVAYPILRKIENPNVLSKIETNSPHIAEDSGPLWEAFIRRDISNWQDKAHKPKNPMSWGKVYNKLKKEQEMQIEKEKAELKARLQGIKAKKEEMKSSVSDKVNPITVRKKSGWGSGGGGWSDKPAKDSSHYNLGPGGKKTLSGKGFLQQIQNKAKDTAKLNVRPQIQNRPLGTVDSAPRSMLSNGRRPMPVDNGRVAAPRAPAVPKSMMRPEHIQAARERAQGPSAPAPTRTSSAASVARREEEIARKEQELKAREDRLKALARGTAPASTSSSQHAAGSKRPASSLDADRAAKRRREITVQSRNPIRR